MNRIEELKREIEKLDARREKINEQIKQLESGNIYEDSHLLFEKKDNVYAVYDKVRYSTPEAKMLIYSDKDLLKVLKWMHDLELSLGIAYDVANQDLLSSDSVDGEKALEMTYDGYSSHDATAYYECPACNEQYNSYQFGMEKMFRCRKCNILLKKPK